jgi:hypothetical protein
VHPSSAGGVLLEICQHPIDHSTKQRLLVGDPDADV